MPARKRTTEDKPVDGKQINFRAPLDLSVDLEEIAAGLGLDVSNLVRMVLRENLASYRQRAERVRQERIDTKKKEDK